MGFLSGLGKLLSIAGPIAAIPFTGGASAGLLGMSAGTTAALGGALGAAGAGLGAASNASAQNRDAQFSGQMDLATLLNQREMDRQHLLAGADNDYTANQISRSQEGRASGQDAWRKLLSAQHTLNPSAMPNVSPYAQPRAQPSAATRQGADALTSEVMARLQGGNPIADVTKRPVDLAYDPMSTIDPRLLKAGKGEKVGGILGAILGGIGGGFMGGGMNGGGMQPQVMPRGPQLSPVDMAFLRKNSPQIMT